MKYLRTLPCAGAWALLLLAAPQARADRIPLPHWTEWWSVSPVSVQADKHEQSKVVFTNFGTHQKVTGSSTIGVANLYTGSKASDNDPDTFTHRPWTLVLHLVDNASKQSGTLTFHGWFTGTVSQDSSNIRAHFDKQEQKIHLGQWWYDVRLNPFAPPGPPGTGLGTGAISASVRVKHNPEPTALLLAGLGGPLLGLQLWRRRRARRRAQAA